MNRQLFLPEKFVNNCINVLVAGAGGTGGEVLDGLSRIDMALRSLTDSRQYLDVTVFDPDTVSPANIGRQRFCQHDINHNKAIQIVQRINTFYGLNWKAYPRRMPLEPNAFNHSVDLVISCTDKAAFRATLGQMYKYEYASTLWLDFGNSQASGQVILGHLGRLCGNTPKVPNVFDLYPELAESEHFDGNDIPSCSLADALGKQDLFINRTVADAGLGMLWRLLSKGSIDYHGVMIDLSKPAYSYLKICPEFWSYMGYDEHAATETSDEPLSHG